MKIGEDVSIGVLYLELAKLGVTYLFSRIVPGATRPFLVTVGRPGLECSDTGTTPAEAYDGAVARFAQRVARRDHGTEIDRGD